MEWQPAPDLKSEVKKIILHLDFSHINPKQIFTFRSFGSRSRARARIWGFPRIWQQALKTSASYCLEVISEKFDHLSEENKQRILIHELLHIPKNFSGALLAHRRRGAVINAREVEKLFKKLKK
ncbi:metallopeptidase [Candidatus Shapirobacteria bacterium CG10_big_fil_rev_8_21_14_0_10_38_14]|uniref:Metallopeptidase n=1 Tax=Candidatus Shapirobacteria bacterium CG10_big_fil_rev_8_21_14_0_10_38_14 TaxID=1974483 RepID=A0A2M8L5I4_9BACT|nr:MAG: metallopeptidase [Candidatus Shapirobacteria bacterium CG10_big_fil_rev_8_21_14_0_10_38_14]